MLHTCFFTRLLQILLDFISTVIPVSSILQFYVAEINFHQWHSSERKNLSTLAALKEWIPSSTLSFTGSQIVQKGVFCAHKSSECSAFFIAHLFLFSQLAELQDGAHAYPCKHETNFPFFSSSCTHSFLCSGQSPGRLESWYFSSSLLSVFVFVTRRFNATLKITKNLLVSRSAFHHSLGQPGPVALSLFFSLVADFSGYNSGHYAN